VIAWLGSGAWALATAEVATSCSGSRTSDRIDIKEPFRIQKVSSQSDLNFQK